MYKLLLCWRYLKTRYLAMACIISVMLGVATLIVVNSVMSGFSTKLREKLHSLLSDVVMEAHGLEGFGDPDGKMAKIRNHPVLGPRVEAMASTMEVPAMVQYRYPSGHEVTRVVKVIGVDPVERSRIGGFREHLVNQANREKPTFELSEEAKEIYRDQQRKLLSYDPKPDAPHKEPAKEVPPPPVPPALPISVPQGAIVGNLIATYRKPNADATKPPEEITLLKLGESIIITTVGGERLAPVLDKFAVVDYFKSDMSEYDSNVIFVPLDYLQHLRTAPDRVTSIQIKLKNYDADKETVVRELQSLFRGEFLTIATWEQKQAALLRAIDIEKGILNVLLFFIIAVAGFGILAIFSMIVAEKTRDIGILKALGASNGGVMKIFLGYGLLLGVVGAGLGSLLGCWFTNHINDIEAWLTRSTGHKVFDPGTYYFDQIPTDIRPWMIVMVNAGAVGIAVLFSVLPALRAALLHPVRALRYE